MKVIETSINGAKIIQPQVFCDNRGFFLEILKKKLYKQMLNIDADFVQVNHSRSIKGVLRGLHFQKTKQQGKLVRVVRGEVYDVAVDIRQHSSSYGKWFGMLLNEENQTQLWLPPGLAHGFIALSDIADFEYKCTEYYQPSDENCLLWNDPDLGIEWPLKSPLISEKDKLGKRFGELTL